MSYANDAPIEKNPTMQFKFFGFDENGNEKRLEFSGVQDLFDKANSGVTNQFTLSETANADGSFTSNSLIPQEVTTLNFNNKSSSGIVYTEFFQMLANNKDDLFLKLTQIGFETTAIFKIVSVDFTLINNTIFTVSLHNSLKRTNFVLDQIYTITFDIENDVFTQTQSDRLKDLVYEKTIQSLSVAPTTFEKGVATNLVFTWNVDKRDDTLVSVDLDSSDVLEDATGVNRTYNVANQVNTKSVTLQTNVTENDLNGGSNSYSNTIISTALVPQFYGNSAFVPSDYSTWAYASLTSAPYEFTKIVQSTSVFQFTETYANEYAWIFSTKQNATIKDGNDFVLTVGDFTSSTAFWLSREVTITLANGDNQTLYLYRTRQTQNGTFTFKIS